jgi:DNA-binding NarL/FixJ family response regulator
VSVRVLVADDQALVRAGFRKILEGDPDIEVVGEAGDGDEAIELTRSLDPDLVLMDIRMPRLDGIAATRALTAADADRPRVLVLTTFALEDYVFDALRAGASGFLVKDTPPGEIINAVRLVASGDAIISPTVTRSLLDHFGASETSEASERRRLAARRLATLTDREREVAAAVGSGASNAEVAASLFMSEATVKAHVSRLLTKLDVTNRVQIAIVVHEAGH